MVRMDLVEINEAFAAQVLACQRAFESRSFCEEHLGTGPVAPRPGAPQRQRRRDRDRSSRRRERARLVLTLLREMERRDLSLGLATLCVGGGQGGAMVVERAEDERT